MSNKSVPAIVGDIIRQRKTEKVLCDVNDHKPVPLALAEQNKKVVLEAVKTAGYAPFHYPRNVDKITEPWRAYVLWDDGVKKTAEYLRDELKVNSKEPSLAAASNALVLVTWIPEFYDVEAQEKSNLSRENQIIHDEEHLAAASAMVQNLLLILTAHDMGTYWSSGGRYRGSEMFDYVGIPQNERLLAAVFIEYPEMMDDDSKQRKPGKLRNTRSENWIREVSVDDLVTK